MQKKFGLEHPEKWYDDKVETILENARVKFMWDMKLQTDKEIEFSRPDIVVM